MKIEGVHPFPKFCATDAVATSSSTGRTILVQCNVKLSQASTEAVQSLKTLAVKDFRRQSHCWVDGSRTLYGNGARRLLNPPVNAPHSLCSLYSLSVTRLERRSLLKFRVFSSVEAVIIDIQDGSVLFKFEHKEQLLSINQLVHTLLQGPRGDPRLFNHGQLMKYLNQLYLREDRTFYSLCSENENDRLSFCNFDNTEGNHIERPANQMMLKQSGLLDPGDCSCTGVFVVSNSNVSIVKRPSLPSEEMNELSHLPGRIDSLYNPYESDSAGGLPGTNLISSYVIEDNEQLKFLPCSSSIKGATASILPTLMSNFIKMKMALQYRVWSKNSSECNDCYDVLFQNKVMQSNRCENVMMMPSLENARKPNWADSSSSSAATLNMIDKDNLEPFSAHSAPSQRERKKLGLKEKQVKPNYQLRVMPTNENRVLSRRQLKKSGGRNHPRLRESIRKPISNPRDLFCRSSFQVYELFLTYRFTNDPFRDFKYKQVKKACLEIANVLNQLAVGLAGSGLAIILFIVSRLLKLNSTFDYGKGSALLRGFCLIWMSTAIQNVRTLILKLCYGSNTPAEDEVRRLHREMKNLSLKALTATVVSLIGYVK